MNLTISAAIAMLLCAFVAACNGGSSSNPTLPAPDPAPPPLQAGQVIPSDVQDAKQKITFATPPLRYKAAQGWAQAVTLSKGQTGETAKLEMDYLRLLVEANPLTGAAELIAEATFDSPSPTLICNLPSGRCDGALYERSPWFGSDAHVPMTNSIVSNGTLQIDVAQTPNKVAHWWTPRVQESVPGRRYFIETRFKITGKAALQLGVDYWFDVGAGYNFAQDDGCKNGSNVCQGWASIWFGETGGEFVVKKVPVFP